MDDRRGFKHSEFPLLRRWSQMLEQRDEWKAFVLFAISTLTLFRTVFTSIAKFLLSNVLGMLLLLLLMNIRMTEIRFDSHLQLRRCCRNGIAESSNVDPLHLPFRHDVEYSEYSHQNHQYNSISYLLTTWLLTPVTLTHFYRTNIDIFHLKNLLNRTFWVLVQSDLWRQTKNLAAKIQDSCFTFREIASERESVHELTAVVISIHWICEFADNSSKSIEHGWIASKFIPCKRTKISTQNTFSKTLNSIASLRAKNMLAHLLLAKGMCVYHVFVFLVQFRSGRALTPMYIHINSILPRS